MISLVIEDIGGDNCLLCQGQDMADHPNRHEKICKFDDLESGKMDCERFEQKFKKCLEEKKSQEKKGFMRL